jgi:hypothetical protein
MYFEKVDYFAMIVVEVVRLNNRELFRKKIIKIYLVVVE